MKLHRLHRSQVIPADLEATWAFYSDPRNLAAITPPSLGFEIRSGAEGGGTYAGQLITYTIRPLAGLPLTWVSEITHLREPGFFVDEQRFGPYRFWHHQHNFKPVPGGTLVEDLVHYALPFGPAGRLVNRLLVARRLREVFDYRVEALVRRFGPAPAAPDTSSPTPLGASSA